MAKKYPEYIPITETLPVKGKGQTIALELRGLNLLDLTELFKVHLPDLGALATLIDENGGASMGQADMMKTATALVKEAPGLVASVICRAADDETWLYSAGKLPFMTQIQAVTIVARLTFEEVGGIKKTMAALKQMAAAEGGLESLIGGQG